MHTRLILLVLTSALRLDLPAADSQPRPSREPVATRAEEGPDEPRAPRRNPMGWRAFCQGARSAEFHSELEKPTSILWIVTEGTTVKKGDLLVELDGGALRDQLEACRIEVAKAQAGLAQARAALSAAQQEMENARETRQQRLKLAEWEQKKAQADLELQLQMAETELNLAKERLRLAQNRVARADEHFKKGRISEEELEQAQLHVLEARAAMEIAQARQKYLAEHLRPYQAAVGKLAIADLAADVRHFELASGGQNEVEAVRLEVLTRELAYEETRSRLARLEDQISKSQIHAPFDGLVRYVRRTGSPTPLGAGITLRNRQPILQLEDPRELQFVVVVDEPHGSRLRVGQSAAIRLDAFPQETFQGKVTRVGEAPRSPRTDDGTLKRYRGVVVIDDPPPELKPGMTASVEIPAIRNKK